LNGLRYVVCGVRTAVRAYGPEFPKSQLGVPLSTSGLVTAAKRGDHHHDEAQPHEDESPGKLGGDRGILRPQPHPEPCDDWRERDDEKRIDGLEPVRRIGVAEDYLIRAAPGEQVERGDCLSSGSASSTERNAPPARLSPAT
jgi:hypothetical protein